MEKTVVEKLLALRTSDREAAYVPMAILDEAIAFLGGEPRWEYGHASYSVFGKFLGVHTTSRTPDNWLTTMGTPYRRLAVIGGWGEWELFETDVTYELDPAPWLRPGGDPLTYPERNRSRERLDKYTFNPRGGYQKDSRAYV